VSSGPVVVGGSLGTLQFAEAAKGGDPSKSTHTHAELHEDASGGLTLEVLLVRHRDEGDGYYPSSAEPFIEPLGELPPPSRPHERKEDTWRRRLAARSCPHP
jgi:hypothetical protein